MRDYAVVVQAWDKAITTLDPKFQRRSSSMGSVMPELGKYCARKCEPVVNALGMPLHGTIAADPTRFASAPRRHNKRTLVMATRGNRSTYQGNGVWGSEPAPEVKVKAAKRVRTPKIKVARVKLSKPSAKELVFDASTHVMVRPGVFKRVSAE